jgi:cleavage and polyadenylation specificity factor subunit 2
MLRVTPIYGSRWEGQGPAPLGNCTLVEYADVKVLINIGGPVADFDWHTQLPEHDCVVLTDSTVESMGSLPLYHRSPGSSSSQVYATFPTVKMGQMSLYDHHANLCLDGACPPFSLEEMDQAFAELQTIKYAQTLLLPKDKPRLSITAYRAGHVVGGAFYVLQRLQDETSVVITSTYHIAKELHLDSSTLLQYGATPDVLITSPGGPAMKLLSQLYATKKMVPPLVTQSQRSLVEHILSVLRRDGNVLLPVDASGRVLELVLLLSQHWERHRLEGTYNLVWLGPMVANTIDFCRSQLEWMANALGNQFDSPGKGHPYAMKPVQLCTSVMELEAILANGNPTCVLANGPSLDHGPARDLLLKWCHDDNNAILFTDSSQCHIRPWKRKPKVIGKDETAGIAVAPAGIAAANAPSASQPVSGAAATSTAAAATEQEETQEDSALGVAISEDDASEYTTSYQLLHHWCKAKLEDREMEDSVEVDVLVPRRAPLAGPELKRFLDGEEAARLSKRKREEEQAMLREVELAKGRLRLGEEQPQQPIPPPASDAKTDYTKTMKYAVPRPKKKSRFDSTLFLKFSKPLHCKFVYVCSIWKIYATLAMLIRRKSDF